MKNNKGFVVPLLLGIIAVLVIGGGVYIYQTKKSETPATVDNEEQQQVNTSNPPANTQTNNTASQTTSTSNWRTYTSTQYGFSIKYPSNYTFTTKQDANIGLGVQYENASFPSPLPRIVNFSTKDSNLEYSYLSVFADNSDGNLNQCLKDPNSKNSPLTQTKKINGNQFYVSADHVNDSAMGGERGKFSEYRLIHGGYCYIVYSSIVWREVGWGGNVSNGVNDATPEQKQAQLTAIQKNTEALDNILSTFKFTSSNQAPVIKINVGPQELNVNQVGTWTVNAYNPNDKGEGSTLTYSEKWGDSNTVDVQYPPFKHAYSQTGKYTIVFTARDGTAGAQTSVSTSVDVLNSTSTGAGSGSQTPSITIFSPNGGQNLKIGSTYTIEWASNPANMVSPHVALVLYDTLGHSKQIAPSVSLNGSYNWTIPNMPTGSYKIGAYLSGVGEGGGGAIQDSSDNYFTITSN